MTQMEPARARRYFSRLQGKLLVIFLILSLIPIQLVAWLSLRNGEEALKQTIGLQLEVRAQHTVDAVEQFFLAGQISLQNWARLSVMYDLLADDPDGRITGSLITLERESSNLGALLAINRAGVVVAASQPALIGTSVKSTSWFLQALEDIRKKTTNVGINWHVLEGDFYVTVPVMGGLKSTTTLGYLVARLSEKRLSDVVAALSPTVNDKEELPAVYVMTPQGKTIGHKDGDFSSTPDELRRIMDGFTGQNENGQPHSTGWSLMSRLSAHDVLVGYAGAHAPTLAGWRVVVTQEASIAFRPVRDLRMQILWVGLLLAIVVIPFSLMVSRRMSQPIEQITLNAARLATGSLTTVDLPVARRDEIGSLAVSFQHMAEQLRLSTDKLEQRVQERTIELEDRNVRLRDEMTERLRVEQSLRQSEERFRLLIEQVRDYAIISLDCEGRVLTWNLGAQRMKGYAAVEILHQHFGRFYTKEDQAADRPNRLIGNARTSGRATDEGWRVRKDGSRFWADVSVTAIYDDQGRLSGFAKVTRDITDRKKADLALQASERTLTVYTHELEQRNKELEQFTYVASHDLAEPLRMVSSYCGLLKRRYQGKLDADADEFIGYAVDGAARMQNLIQDLLALSRVDSKRKPFQVTDCESLLAQTLANLRLLMAQHHAVVTHDPLPTVVGDETQLGQVLQNLIGNAIKFHGKTHPEVHVTSAIQGEEYLFTVRDNGIGFDPKQADRIFVVFQRLHTKEEYPGTGIGLSICKKIVERHGGRIWAESTPGAGSRFLFTIPIQRAVEETHDAETAA